MGVLLFIHNHLRIRASFTLQLSHTKTLLCFLVMGINISSPWWFWKSTYRVLEAASCAVNPDIELKIIINMIIIKRDRCEDFCSHAFSFCCSFRNIFTCALPHALIIFKMPQQSHPPPPHKTHKNFVRIAQRFEAQSSC